MFGSKYFAKRFFPGVYFPPVPVVIPTPQPEPVTVFRGAGGGYSVDYEYSESRKRLKRNNAAIIDFVVAFVLGRDN